MLFVRHEREEKERRPTILILMWGCGVVEKKGTVLDTEELDVIFDNSESN